MCLNKKTEIPVLPEGFTVTFHAGAMNTKDNTPESLQKALDENADVAELDVSFLPDGTPVLIHNDKPTDVNLPRLDDALAMTARYEKTKLNLDLKNVSNLPAIDALVEKHGLTDRVFYTGVGEDWIETVRTQSKIPYYLNAILNPLKMSQPAYIEEFCKKMKDMGALGLNAFFGTVCASAVKGIQAQGLLVSLWTVDKTADMFKVLSYAPDNITTNKPDKLRRILSE